MHKGQHGNRTEPGASPANLRIALMDRFRAASNAEAGMANGMAEDPVIVPPQTIRRVLDTTAAWVSKKGKEFEDKLIARHVANQDFSFLYPGDPYHAYYLQQVGQSNAPAAASINQASNTDTPTVSDRQTAPLETVPEPAQADDEETVSKVAPEISKSRAALVKAAAARPVPQEPPEPDVFSIALNVDTTAPTNLELEVIKLTAQFAAKNGRGFLASITVREGRNPLFDFLSPGHQHFDIFHNLSSAYSRIMNPTETMQKNIQQVYPNTVKMIDRAHYKADWARIQELKQADEDADTSDFHAVDWSDFVVVETVLLDDEEVNLPAPITAKDIAAEIQKRETVARAAEEEEEADMDIDMDDDEQDELAPIVGDIPKGKVRKDYVPDIRPALAAEHEANRSLNVLLPSGQTVPVNEATESMKVHLLDPKYKEEKSRAAEKNANLNLASNAEIARNLDHLNARKTGVFGHKDLQVAVAAQKAANPTTVPPPATIQPVTVPLRSTSIGVAVEEDLGHQDKRPRIQEPEPEAPKPRGLPEAGGPLLAAEEWTSRVGANVTIRVQLPQHANKDWELNGRIVDLEVPLSATIGQLKATLFSVTKCPANKQKIQVEGTGFLKDAQSLAYYNIRPATTFLFDVKERGGKKR